MKQAMRQTVLLALWALLSQTTLAGEPTQALGSPHLARFGTGAGATQTQGVLRLLDDAGTAGQSNAIAFDRSKKGAYDAFRLRAKLRVLEGGDGGAFLFLATDAYGVHGPAPFLASWVEPNLKGTFAIGIDVHNPPSKEMFSPWGNYENQPQREISLHWDGREIVKRVAPNEFRGDFAEIVIDVQHVIGGAEVTVEIAGATVYEKYFLANFLPYEARLAIGAGTRADASTEFDVKDIAFTTGPLAAPQRKPLHVEVFNHVLTDNKKTAYTAEVSLPPANWAFSRVIMTIDIHDAGENWDEWDRNGEVSLYDADGTKHPLVPFITSYRTPCHWAVDVTHFRPYLTGPKRLEIQAGTNFYKSRGYMMSLSLDYFHGTPAFEPYRIDPLWVGQAKYKSAENHFRDFFEEQTVSIGEETTRARIYTTTTGHSQIGEFTPSPRQIVVACPGQDGAPTEQRFDNVLWKTDCYLNPNRPQFGTWQYARAGWAPGDVVRPWVIDLPPPLVAGEATFRYQPEPYSFPGKGESPPGKQINQASHVVRSYLVQYRAPTALVPAPSLRVTNVAGKSSAAQAGMKTGDYLASYDGKRIDSIADLRAALQAAKDQETVAVVVFRGAQRLELTVKTGRLGINLGTR